MAQKIFDTPDTTVEFAAEDIELNNRLSCLSYLGILLVVPLFLVKKSRFAKFHANQGLVLLILNIAASAILGVISFIVNLIGTGIAALFVKLSVHAAFLATVGSVISVILSVITGILSVIVSILLLFLLVVGIIYAAKGRAKELPLIGRFKILKY